MTPDEPEREEAWHQMIAGRDAEIARLTTERDEAREALKKVREALVETTAMVKLLAGNRPWSQAQERVIDDVLARSTALQASSL